ncbi:glycosyltransferase family 2 protein [Geothrix paludis]|uniref:glycosyltransferase family 2 protein n=1 Tax=Geothrix paludis TaxID=2922722 RepID=UPI001FAB79D6|nr:glycosyltransferase family 2 protein [Geothrix paludis]
MAPHPSPRISIVAPTYRCSTCLVELHRRIVSAFAGMPGSDFELILVNDGSPEDDWQRIEELATSDSRIKGINLSRNFGQHHAISAGVDHADGDWVVVMDADLQDRPEEIPRLYEKAMAGDFDVVFAQRVFRQDPVMKVLLSRAFNLLINTLSSLPIDPTIGNFSIASRQVITAYRKLRESSRSYGLGILWCGFRVGYLPVEHGARFAGRSSYSLGRSIHLALESITSLSNKPLRMAINVGFSISFTAFLYGLYLILRYLFHAVPVPGWTSTVVSVYFLSGMILAFMGILGLYLGKVFDEVKGRPLYIIRKTLNFDQEQDGV